MQARLDSRLRAARRIAAPLLVLVLLYAPSVSHACSQCLATRTRANQLAFIWTTVFLSVAPLVVVGSIALWLRKKLREADAAGAAAEHGRSDELPLPSAAPIH